MLDVEAFADRPHGVAALHVVVDGHFSLRFSRAVSAHTTSGEKQTQRQHADQQTGHSAVHGHCSTSEAIKVRKMTNLHSLAH